jgi:hypothetical protein
VKNLFLRALLILLALVLLVYGGDYISIRFRIPGQRAQFGSVHLQPYLAVPQKSGKTEFILDTPVDQTCVYSLFPQLGYQPCWYLSRHKAPRTNL